ncbi:MAG: carbonic anhydrase [Candidatus Dependentiae bacterium]
MYQKKIISCLSLIVFSMNLIAMNEAISYNADIVKRKRILMASNNKPKDKLILITCMDTRINPYALFGISSGEAHILRNAGGIVTEDVIRSILLSMHALGTNQIMIVKETNCGLTGLNDNTFRADLMNKFKTDTVVPQQFYGFSDLKENIKQQMQKIKNHPWIPNDIKIRGFILDIKTGGLNEVKP